MAKWLTKLWQRIARWPGIAPLLFWAISLFLFLLHGWDVIGADGDLPFDASWYLRIARDGYLFDGDYNVQQNVAFFPMHPAVIAVVQSLGGISYGHAQLVGCAAMTLAACLLFHRVLLHEFGEPVAKMSIGLWVANPFAIYLFNGYSEAAFVVCVALLFYFLVVKPRMHWVVLAIIGASLARPYGIFLSLVFFLYVLHKWRWGREPKWLKVLFIHVPLTFAGYVGWSVYCDLRFGDPMATLHATAAWIGHSIPLTLDDLFMLEAPIKALRRLVTGDDLLDPVALGVIFFFGGICLFITYARRFSSGLALYGLLLPLMLLPIVAQAGGVYNAGRYELPYVVHYAALALLLVAVDRKLIRQDTPSLQLGESLPPIFYPVYLLFLSAFIRYTQYFFDRIWVS